MQYIENEKCETRTIESFWNSNNNVAAQAAFVFSVPEGSYSVNISSEGLQSVDHIGGSDDGFWIGLIAYSNASDDNWGVGNYKGCTFKNLMITNSWRPGHKDLKLNGCQFTDGQIVERDAVISFHLEAQGKDAKFCLTAPRTMKTDKYNYVVSYGGYTNKRMEFGTISVTFDEADVEAERLARHHNTPRRKHHVLLSEGYEFSKYGLRDKDLYDRVESDSEEDTPPAQQQEERTETRSDSSDGDSALRAYEAATAVIPDAEEGALPSREDLTKKPIDTLGNLLPKPKPKEPEVLGTYQGQNIYPEDVPPGIRQRLREAAKAPTTALYSKAPKRDYKSILSRFVESNRNTKDDAAPSEATNTTMTTEQAKEYTRIRNSRGLTAAREYKASLQ